MRCHALPRSRPALLVLGAALSVILVAVAALLAYLGIALGLAPSFSAAVLAHVGPAPTASVAAPRRGSRASRRTPDGGRAFRPLPHPT
jgi:hypothetical protein